MNMFRVNGPLVIGGMGGSGTRVYLRLARLAGWRMIVCPWWERNRRKIEEGSGDCQPLMKHFYPKWLHRWQRGDMTDAELRLMRFSCRFWLFASDPAAHIPFLQRFERWPLDDHETPNLRGWGWKNPRAMNLLPFLNDLFPSMRYIQVIRDGRDHAFHPEFTYGNYQSAVLSEKEEHLPDHIRKGLVWARRNEQTETYGNQHMPGRYLHSRLEDLCEDPAGEIARLYKFLGLAAHRQDEGLARASLRGGGGLSRGRGLPGSIDALVAQGCKLVGRPGSLGRWRDEEPGRIAEAEGAMSPVLEQLGYQRSVGSRSRRGD